MTSPSPQVSLIVDDSNNAFFHFDNSTASTNLPLYYLTTLNVAGSPTAAENTTFVEIFFDGTSIVIFGTTATPQTTLSEEFTVVIDDGDPYTTSSSDPSPPSYRQWYQSPQLEDGTHNITLSNVFGASIDYAVITADISTNVAAEADQIIIVDNNDPSINYAGRGWTETTDTFTSSYENAVTVVPYGNSTHKTSSFGSSFSLDFTGNELTLYGVFDYTRLGIMNVTFSLDGFTSSTFYEVLSVVENFLDGVIQPNFPLYTSPDGMTAGPHTLVVEVVACENLTLTVDYFTYAPAEAASSPATVSSSSRKSHAGAIAGGIVGGLAFLLITALILDCVRRRKRQLRHNFMYPFQRNAVSSNGIPLASIQGAAFPQKT